MGFILDPLYNIVSGVIVAIHKVLTPIFGTDSGVTWTLSIMGLVVLIRIILIPLFVKQIKSQRAREVQRHVLAANRDLDHLVAREGLLLITPAFTSALGLESNRTLARTPHARTPHCSSRSHLSDPGAGPAACPGPGDQFATRQNTQGIVPDRPSSLAWIHIDVDAPLPAHGLWVR